MTEKELKILRTQRGQLLMLMRHKKKISKSMMSRKSGLKRPTIDNIESGNKSYNINSYLIYIHTLKSKR